MKKSLLSFVVSTLVFASFAAPASAQKYTATIESTPAGQTVDLYKKGKEKVIKSCETPCVFKLKASKLYELKAVNNAGQTIYLPINAPTDGNRSFDIKVYFDVNDDSATALSMMRDAPPEAIYPRGETPPRPLVRMPGHLPPSVSKSGHCEMIFDVQETGRPTNIRAKSCSSAEYAPVSIEAVARFKYRPQGMRENEEWQAVYSTGEETKLTYRVLDKEGNVLAE